MAMALHLMNTPAAMPQLSAATTAAIATAPAAVTVQLNNSTFHDFLGVTKFEDHPSKPSGSSPAATGASSGGGRGGPISATSGLGSEMQVGNPIKGVPFYGPRSDVSGSEIVNNRLMRYKRSNSDSSFMGAAREHGTLHIRPEEHDKLPPMKMLRSGLGGEIRPRQLPPPSSPMLHHPRTFPTSRPDPRFAPSPNMGPTFQSPLRSGPFMPPVQPPLNLQRGVNYHVIGAPVASQSAASDEGSRTGFKTQPGLLNFSQAGSSENNRSVNTDPKGSNPRGSGHGIDVEALVGRQMTIFYGGQAHVFDEVNPAKADLIMNLAGSKGGTWSTSSTAPPQDPRQQIPGSSQLSLGFNDRRFSNTTGGLPRSILGRDAGNPTHHVAGDENKNL